MSIRKLFGRLLAARLSKTGNLSNTDEESSEKLWQSNYDARQNYFESSIGPLPTDILKMLNMTGVWPGGGLFVISAPKFGHNLSVYTTFGFTNPDMPATVKLSNFELKVEGNRTTKANGTLSKKEAVPKLTGFAGYGYEIIMVAESNQQWPLNFLQWAVNAEIGHDAGLLTQVEKYDGLTVEQIQVEQGQLINVLIARAHSPLPTGKLLPAGRMEVLVATLITDQEMHWSQANGRGALLKKLQEAGVGQVSIQNRLSIL